MPTELRTNQRRMLYQLLTIKESIETLDGFITQLKAEMDEEDFAYVEKQVSQFQERRK